MAEEVFPPIDLNEQTSKYSQVLDKACRVLDQALIEMVNAKVDAVELERWVQIPCYSKDFDINIPAEVMP